MKLKTTIRESIVALLALVLIVGVAYATTGSFTPPTGTTANYRTLGDIHAKLTNFALNPSATHSVSTTTSPAGSFHTLGEIYTLLTDENQDLIASKIATGTVIFGVRGTLESDAGGDALSWSTNQGRGELVSSNVKMLGSSRWHYWLEITNCNRNSLSWYARSSRRKLANNFSRITPW